MKENIRDVYVGRLPSLLNTNFLVTVFASFAILIASFANFLRFNGYPLLRPEVALVAVGLLCLTMVVGWLHQGQRPLGKAILEALLIFLVMDQNDGGIFFSALAAALVAGFVLVRKRSTLPFLGFAAVITFLVGLLGVGASIQENERASAASTPGSVALRGADVPPALLHVILDEHIGVEGLPPSNPRSAAMKNILRNFYVSHDFRLFGRAYSEHFHTVNSIPQIMNFGRSQPPSSNQTEGTDMKQNAYFELLRNRGYRIHVYQSDFLDFCRTSPVHACNSYDSARLALLTSLPLAAGDRAGLIAVRFFLLSSTAEKMGQLYGWSAFKLRSFGVRLPDFGLSLAGRVSAINAVAAFDHLIEDLKEARPGNAYFAHMLLPHYPYATGTHCEVRSKDEWMLRRSATPRVHRENAYFDQIQCATRKVGAALSALEKSPAGKDFVVIIHGDHGSRITRIEPIAANIGRFDDSDIIAGFSTIFAVRAKGIKPGYDSAPASVPALLKDLSLGNFSSAPSVKGAKHPAVMLDDVRWIPVRPYPLPEKWQKGE